VDTHFEGGFWERCMRAFRRDLWRNDPHQGTVEAFLVRERDLRMIRRSLRRENLALARALRIWVEEISWGGDKSPLCLTCEFCFRAAHEVAAFSICKSAFTCNPEFMLVSAICQQCAERSDDDLLRACFRGLRWMGLATELRQSGSA
jgi:hypothetical protein